MDTRTKQYFEVHASQFDSLYHEGQPLARAMNRWLRKAIYERFAITFQKAEPVVGKTVLDVGCGSGRYAIEFARRGASRVVGIDYSGGMLLLARELAAGQGVADRCEFIQRDFMAQPLPEHFDVVIAIGVFDYQPQALEFLRAMTAACRGKVIATFPGRSLVRMPLRRFRYWLGNCPVLFYREAEVRALAEQAGFSKFSVISIESSGTGFVLVGEV